MRCKYWVVCTANHCVHHEVHGAHNSCNALQPVKYCGHVKGFVTEIDSNYECDPNLAFKAKLDADRRRDDKYRRAMTGRRKKNPWDEDREPWDEDREPESYDEWREREEHRDRVATMKKRLRIRR